MNLFDSSPWAKALLTAVAVVTATLAALGLHQVGVADASIVLTLLMAVVVCSWAFGLGYSILASLLAILSHSYFFSEPLYSFEVYEPQHVIAFAFMVVVGVVISTLSGRLQDRVKSLAVREARLEALHRLGQGLSGQVDRTEAVATAETLLSTILEADVTISEPGNPPTTGTPALALTGSHGSLGWVTLASGQGAEAFLPDRKVWVETLLAPVALALERVDLIRDRETQAKNLEATQTRNTILHGISHDLRTPLTVVSATAGTLLEKTGADDPRRPDLESLAAEAQGLVRQVENLLELTSLQSGSVAPRREWVPLEDLIYPCLQEPRSALLDPRPTVSLPGQPVLCFVDETLVIRALSNLLENAATYAPGPVDVRAEVEGSIVRVAVADRGPGVPETETQAIFSPFVRGANSRRKAGYRGTGLGLALVQTVAGLHGGRAGVEARSGGGSVFWFTIDQGRPVPPLWGATS